MKEKNNHNEIWKELNDLRNNHVSHIEADMASLKTDVCWLKENYKANKQLTYGILATSLAGLLMGVVKLL